MNSPQQIDVTKFVGLTVLCVEDEPEAREVMARYLTRQGLTVFSAANGEQGLALFKERHPHIVISDLRMPVMDGVSMCKVIHELDPEVPIIITTAHNETDLLVAAIDFGVTKYINKPVNLNHLNHTLVAVSNLLEKKKVLEDRLKKMSSIIDEVEYETEKLQSYVVRSMEGNNQDKYQNIRPLYLPKGEISGDFYCTAHHNDHLYAMVADGAGHGMSAILPALQVPRIFKERARQGLSLPRIASEINHILKAQNLTEHFVASTLIRMSYREGFIEVLNCGNPNAILRAPDGRLLHEFTSQSCALGLLHNEAFEVEIQRFEQKTPANLYVFTDGLPDSLNPLFSSEFDIKHELAKVAAEHSFDHIVSLVNIATEKNRPDDITFLEIKFQEDLVNNQNLINSFTKETIEQLQLSSTNTDILARLKNAAVLLVEDDAETLEYMARFLRRRVGKLYTAKDGKEGLALYQKHHQQLVITDIHMPEMSGVAMLRAIREINQDVQIILISGSMQSDNIEDVMNLKVNKFIKKPCAVEKLFDAMQDCVQQFDSMFGVRLSASVFISSPLAITITNKDRDIIAVNPAFSSITGYAQEEVIGHNPKILSSGKHPPEFYQKMWESIHKTGRWSGELWNRRRNGEIFLEWLTINVVRDASNRISHYVAVFSDITERNIAETKIRHLAQHDSLTDLPNRILFADRARQALLNAQRQKDSVAIMYLDVDRFKTINDTLGHNAGDELLCHIANTLVENVRETDTVCRLGGDEFAILLPNAGSREMICRIASKINSQIHKPHTVAGKQLSVGISIGISVYPKDGEDVDALLEHADSAMYTSKRSGQNHYCFFDTTYSEENKRAWAIQQGVKAGLAHHEFSMVYQPKYSQSKQKIIGAEALIRWHSPTLGEISPSEFIPIAEESGLIVEIGEWVISTVAQQVARWKHDHKIDLPVSINISTLHFQRGNVVSSLLKALEENEIDANLISLELTEDAVMQYSEATLKTLAKLKEYGFKVSINNFGTGYSSMSYLRSLPLDELKIDRSLIKEITPSGTTDDISDTAIPLAIIHLARNLKLNIIADGVETEAQQTFLAENGCDVIQGHVFSKPLTPENFSALLATV